MKGFVWISDVHFSIQTLELARTCMKQALSECVTRRLPLLVSGDLCDTKAVLRSEVIRAILNLVEEYAGIDIFILVGNHDLESERSLEFNSLRFLKQCHNVTIIDNPRSFQDWFKEYYFIPYQNSSEKFLAYVRAAKEFGFKRIICHQGFFGAKMGNYAVDQTSVSPLEMNDFEIVLTGHYHEHHRTGPKDHIIYCGSPYTVTFAEAGQRKFIHVVQLDGSIESIPTNVRKHISYDLHQGQDTTFVVHAGENDLLRLQLFGERAWINSFNKEQLIQKYGCKNISIVPKPQKQNTVRIEQKNVFNVGEVVNSYLETAVTELDKVELLDFFAKELQ